MIERIFGVDLTEAKLQVSDFHTFNEFFTRELLPDARPLDPDQNAILSPVDGFVGERDYFIRQEFTLTIFGGEVMQTLPSHFLLAGEIHRISL